MRHVVIIFTLFMISAACFAADKDTGKQPPQAPGAEAIQGGSKQKAEKDKKAPEWPRPYQPSEKISVDSTVPFPTDI